MLLVIVMALNDNLDLELKVIKFIIKTESIFLLKNLNRNAHCGCPVTSASWAEDILSLLKTVYFSVFWESGS